MCRYFSCIVIRKKCLWLKNSIKHEDIIKENKLKDDKLKNRDFVRIEIVPKSLDKITRNKSDWVFKLDEEETLPEWYLKKEKNYESMCWSEWEKSIKINLAIKNEKVNIRNKFILACDNSFVRAWDNSTIKACDNSVIESYNNSIVEAWDNSTVEACGSSIVRAYDDSTVKAWDNSTVKACDDSTVKAWDNSIVEAQNSSVIIEEGDFNGKIILRGVAKKVKRGG